MGAAEPKFFAQLLTGLGLGGREDLIAQQYDRQRWPDLHQLLEHSFRGRTLAEWCSIFAKLDGCVTPVLTMTEAPTHPHNAARSTFVSVDGVVQPGPAPRFSKTPAHTHAPPPRPCQHTREVLSERGFSDTEIDQLLTTEAAVTEHVQPTESPLSPSTKDGHP